MISKGVTCSKAHHFGYPAVTFRGWNSQPLKSRIKKWIFSAASEAMSKLIKAFNHLQTAWKLTGQIPNNSNTTHQSILGLVVTGNEYSNVYGSLLPQMSELSIRVGGWTNPFEKYAQVKMASFSPKFGVKKTCIWNHDPEYVSQKKTLQKSHALKILLDLFEPDFICQGAIIPIEGGIIPYIKQFARLFVVRQCRHPAKRSYKWNKASSLNMSKHDIILTTNLGNWYTPSQLTANSTPKWWRFGSDHFPFQLGSSNQVV